MNLDLARARAALQAFAFRRLFIEDLGWANYAGNPFEIRCNEHVSLLTPIAEQGGLPVLLLEWPQNNLPRLTARRAVHRAISSRHFEHLVCYVSADRRQLAFTWARRRPDGKTELRTLPYEIGSPARTTLERLAYLEFREIWVDRDPGGGGKASRGGGVGRG